MKINLPQPANVDYRNSDNRVEAFIQWYAWSLKFLDCDPAMWLMNYLNERYEHNSEQRFWFAWLYANTYYLPTAWVLFNEFPDYELATVDRMTWWNGANYKRLRYQTDTKYNKGQLPVMFESYHDNMQWSNQKRFYESLYGDNEKQNFTNIWNYVKNKFFKFGRYTTWFYLQTLKDTAGLIIEPTSLMLDDFKGSKSHRNGLLYAWGMDNLVDEFLDKRKYANLESAACDLMDETRHQFPGISQRVDMFTMETALCAFKKIFRVRDSRYLGYYLDRQGEEITKVGNDGWHGIEWDVLWQARQETLDPRLSATSTIDKSKFETFYHTGRIERVEWLWER